jgi:hypothetical protein
MNEQLETLTTTALTDAVEWVQSIASVAKEQMPLLCEEIVAKGQALALIWSVLPFCIALCCACFLTLIAWYAWKNRATLDLGDDEGSCLFFTGVILTTVGGIFGASCLQHLGDYVSIRVAPRVYVVEQLAEILHNIT